jgi:hypothetical protein
MCELIAALPRLDRNGAGDGTMMFWNPEITFSKRLYGGFHAEPRCSLYLLYWYKSTNTDAAVPPGACACGSRCGSCSNGRPLACRSTPLLCLIYC